MSNKKKHTNYRPEIDGLRAVAVLAVVFYHAGLGCKGGFVGVDVFFVISGFLITGIIIRDLEANNFSLTDFWERRVRRIFPALFACVSITLTSAYFLLLPKHLIATSKAVVAQTFFSSNIYFWRTTNYFDGGNEEKPLLHTWSLSVEEQFYVVVPLILMLFFRFRSLSTTRSLICNAGLAAVASFALSIWGVIQQPFATFFLLPTRAWELLSGSIVALVAAHTSPTRGLTREAVSLASISAIIAPMIWYTDDTPFPGAAAIAPCLGTALLIWANSSQVGSPESKLSFVGRLLSIRCLTFLGLISYSMYLWHWPVIAFAAYWKVAPFSLTEKWLLISLSILLGVVSWRFIETPFRRKQIWSSRRRIFRATIVAMCTLGAVASALIVMDGAPQRIPQGAQTILSNLEQDEKIREKFHDAMRNTDVSALNWVDRLPKLGTTESKSSDFIVLGDSHAQFALPMFDALGTKHGLNGTFIGYQGTPPILNWPYRDKLSAPAPETLWDGALKYVADNRVKTTFLIAYWSSYERDFKSIELKNGLETTIRAFNEAGSTVYLIADVPTYEYDVARSILRAEMFPMFSPRLIPMRPAEHAQLNSVIFQLTKTTSNVLDPSPFLLNQELGSYRVISKAQALFYIDSNHLTQEGVRLTLGPLIEGVFRSLASEKSENASCHN